MKKSKKCQWVSHQDGAPAHTARVVQKWMAENMNFWPKELWPPQSQDLNPLDYSVWWQIERSACATRHPNVGALKAGVDKEWGKMDKAYLINVCKAFRTRLEVVIEAKGGQVYQ